MIGESSWRHHHATTKPGRNRLVVDGVSELYRTRLVDWSVISFHFEMKWVTDQSLTNLKCTRARSKDSSASQGKDESAGSKEFCYLRTLFTDSRRVIGTADTLSVEETVLRERETVTTMCPWVMETRTLVVTCFLSHTNPSKNPIFQFPNFQIWKYPWKIECFLEDLYTGSYA